MKLMGVLLGAISVCVGASSLHAAVADTMTTKFVVDGIPVILRRVTSNEVVTANVYLLGGVRQVTDSTEGIEPFLLDVSERGTRHASLQALQKQMAELGTQIAIDPDVDWTSFGVRATIATFEGTWKVLTDRLMFPKLDSADIAFERERYLAGVRQRDDSPDELVDDLADSVVNAGSPYGRSLTGTERSLAAFTPSLLRQYEATQMVRSRLLIVVVGDVTREHVQQLVASTLGKLPLGNYHWTLPPAPGRRAAGTAVEVSRPLPTNYIMGYFPGPVADNADYQALRVATAALSGLLFEDVRNEHNLAYAVNAPFVEHAISEGGLYVTTEYPDSTLRIMKQEVDALDSGFLVRGALDRLVQQFITEYFLDNETNGDQANFLARAELYRGDYRAADHFVEELRQVTPEDVHRVLNTYMHHLAFAYVGDTTKVSRSLLESF